MCLQAPLRKERQPLKFVTIVEDKENVFYSYHYCWDLYL